MTDLIHVKETNGRESVDARELHAALEVTTRFNDWIARRIENYGFIEGKDFYSKMSKTPEGGRPAVEYALTVAMAKELATVENNDRGREVRRYLIAVEEAWNTPEYVMLRALKYAQAAVEESEKKIAFLQPKADFFDQVADSKTALQMRDVAAALNLPGWGRTKLFLFLREQKILDTRNIPYRQFQDAGYFRVIEQAWTDAKGTSHVHLKTLVYQKGVDYIRRLIKKEVAA
jgi:anti-repressor protein